MPNLFHHIAKLFRPDDVNLRIERLKLFGAAIILAAAWPPLPLGFLALVALVWPLDIISGRSFGEAFRKGYLFSFAYFVLSLYWISWVHFTGMLAACAIIALYSAFIFGLYAAVYRRHRLTALVLMPFLWVGVEYFRTLFEIAFPWSNISYTQVSYVPFIQICEFTGDAGLSLIIVVFNILAWRVWRGYGRRPLQAIIAGLIIAAPTVYGAMVLGQAPPPNQGPIRTALLQGDVSIEDKWNPNNRNYNFTLYDSLATAAVSTDSTVQFLIWPETAAPAYLLYNQFFLNRVAATARRAGKPMLVGTLDFDSTLDGKYFYYNGALQFHADGTHDAPYHKTKLVPFAETVPYGRHIPWLANLSLGWSDFEHGKNLPLYKDDFGDYGILICYEVIFPEIAVEYVRKGADFLVNITNDTWYGWSSGPYQHAGMAPFRAVENRVPIARCANSGISYFVDCYGRIYQRSRLYRKAVIFGNIEPAKERTLFNRTGPILGQFGLLLIVIVSCIMFVVWLKERARKS